MILSFCRYSKFNKLIKYNVAPKCNSKHIQINNNNFNSSKICLINRLYTMDSLKEQNTVTLFQARIRKSINKGNFHTALLHFETMKERNLTPSSKIYHHIIRILLLELDDKDRAKEIYKEMKKNGYELEEDLKSLIDN